MKSGDGNGKRFDTFFIRSRLPYLVLIYQVAAIIRGAETPRPRTLPTTSRMRLRRLGRLRRIGEEPRGEEHGGRGRLSRERRASRFTIRVRRPNKEVDQKNIFSNKKGACGNAPRPKPYFFTKKTPKTYFFTKKGACGSAPGPKANFGRPGAVKLPFKDTFFGILGPFWAL